MPLSSQIHLPMDIAHKVHTFRSGSAIARCINIGDSGMSIKLSGVIGPRQSDELSEKIHEIKEGRKTLTCMKAAILSPDALTKKFIDLNYGTIGAMIVMPGQYGMMVERALTLREYNIFRVIFVAGLEPVALAWLDIH
jgi:hypothetical protein